MSVVGELYEEVFDKTESVSSETRSACIEGVQILGELFGEKIVHPSKISITDGKMCGGGIDFKWTTPSVELFIYTHIAAIPRFEVFVKLPVTETVIRGDSHCDGYIWSNKDKIRAIMDEICKSNANNLFHVVTYPVT